MTMNELEAIEAKYGFRYPELYRALYKDGMLDTGGPVCWRGLVRFL